MHHPIRDDFEQQQFDYVITLCDEARESCLAFQRDGHNLHWNCPDPRAAPGTEMVMQNGYRSLLDQLRRQIEEWAASVDTASRDESASGNP